MSSATELSPEISEFKEAIFNQQMYHGIDYSNLQMYGLHIDETVDYNCLIEPVILMSYWPGGAPNAGHEEIDESILAPAAAQEWALFNDRKSTAGLELSRRAMRRYASFNADLVVKHHINRPPGSDIALDMFCALSNVPAAAIVISRVEKHASIKTNEAIAALYFPTLAQDPRIPLKALKAAQLKKFLI